MRRCMKLIRLILEYTEQNARYDRSINPPEFDDYSESQVQYHIELCEQAGYLTTVASGNYIEHLTWRGQEELVQLRMV